MTETKADRREERVMWFCDRLTGWCAPRARFGVVSGTKLGDGLAYLVWRSYRLIYPKVSK